MKGDWSQLIDDILLAKIGHLNFWRLTQRPVQPEVYDYCDRLGLMTQTDLPLFGCLRRNQFCEAIRQAEEMERLVRAHPCNVLVSYINEPFGGAMGKPHRGYWQPVKPGWHYGCGEFGAEGLDPVATMRKLHRGYWLPQSVEEEAAWTPDRIRQAQTGRFHYCWLETPSTLDEWVTESLCHQAWVTRLMTEAFRRDQRMTSCAIHLFIDAFPAGWMKAIMDVDRTPKPAYFPYREALTPLMANLCTDRFTYWAEEPFIIEAWVCNDQYEAPEFLTLRYQLEANGQVLAAHKAPAQVPAGGGVCQGLLQGRMPAVSVRTAVIVRLALADAAGVVLHETAITLQVFPALSVGPVPRACVIGTPDGPAARLTATFGLPTVDSAAISAVDVILVDDPEAFARMEPAIRAAVQAGAHALLLEWPAGRYHVAGKEIEITPCGLGERHVVSRATGHPLVADLMPEDLRCWYDAAAGYITPLLPTTVAAPGWAPILTSGNGTWEGTWAPALAAAEYADGAPGASARCAWLAARRRIPPRLCWPGG